jgi:hypothetical protein
MKTQQDMDLLNAFRSMGNADRTMLLKLAKNLAGQRIASKPELRLIRGGLDIPLRGNLFRGGS